MKNHQLRMQELEREFERRQEENPEADLYGFLCQAEKDRRFNPTIPGNEKAQELFRRLLMRVGYGDEHISYLLSAPPSALRRLREDLRGSRDSELGCGCPGALQINCDEMRAIRAELDLLRPWVA